MGIEKNLDEIEKNIADACEAKNIARSEIQLVAVTKTIGVERISEAISFGISALGENKVQEIMNKYDKIDKSAQWHMIGHLQTNKVKYIIDKVEMIHSVDSIKLAREINKRAEKAGTTMDCLIQINIGNEESKYGIDYDETESFLDEAGSLKNLRICGLMAIAPHFDNNEKVRPYFKKMNDLFEKMKSEGHKKQMVYLSMGMTHDYLTAIEEGANIVRIGTGIFGERNYLK
ncbi:MAG: YggS family pyridoxal phosphate-dependent enzyme [Peptostreptococcaceae bacterium]|nr:YggS family pyridoxal phosphate-dependent enzyme [Peptostreptococcaceae bacterium]